MKTLTHVLFEMYENGELVFHDDKLVTFSDNGVPKLFAVVTDSAAMAIVKNHHEGQQYKNLLDKRIAERLEAPVSGNGVSPCLKVVH